MRTQTTEQKIQKLENEIIKQKRTKDYFKMRFKDTMKELKQLRKDNEPCLIERNKRQEQIIIDLQKELECYSDELSFLENFNKSFLEWEDGRETTLNKIIKERINELKLRLGSANDRK